MAEGIAACGDHPIITSEQYYQPKDVEQADVCVFYGLEGNTPRLFQDFKSTKTAVYVDLGYWGRRAGGRWAGYHKVVVNDRHPTAYFQRRPMPPDRLARFHVKPLIGYSGFQHIQAWRPKSAPILLAGMGDKGAIAEGFRPEQWERDMVEQIRRHTRRPILYRPKPSWKGAKPIEGCGYSSVLVTAEKELEKAWCVVTHHSNVAVDAMVQGIPAFVASGVASRLCEHVSSIDDIECPAPKSQVDVEQFCADLAYTQWNIDEMKKGLPWQHLKAEGLIKQEG